VLTDGNAHLEQAIFADELSVESLERFREIMAAHWRGMLDQLPAQLEQLIEEDAAAGRRQNQRVRVGLYTWSQPMAAATRHLNLVANNVALPRARASAPAHTLTPKTHPESEP
jgi:Tfp pilus assembly pilus retraction ATPase PilT